MLTIYFTREQMGVKQGGGGILRYKWIYAMKQEKDINTRLYDNRIGDDTLLGGFTETQEE